jgi:mycothiol system anti-sigma-R factor
MNKIVCFVNEAELNLYLDNELPADRQIALSEHVGGCYECSIRFGVARGLKDIMRRGCGNIKAPGSLRAQIMNQIENIPAERSSSFWEAIKNILIVRPMLPIGVAAMLVVAFFSTILLRPSSSGAMKLVSDMVHEHDEYIEGFETGRGIKSADPQEIRNWIAVNSEMKVDLTRCDKFPSLVGACELDDRDRNVSCLFFDQGDKRVSLFMLRSGPTEMLPGKLMRVNDKPVYCGSYTGSNYLLWVEGDMVSILISKIPEDSLIRMAEYLI